MSRGIIHFFKQVLHLEKPLHPVDRRLAKEWIKRRLAEVFPELKDDPEKLERAYRELWLRSRAGDREQDEPETVFEIDMPSGVSRYKR